ncbi:hypothetical protein AB0M75_06585 [Streptomyces anulatus]
MPGHLWLLCSLIGLGLAVGFLIAAGLVADHRITTTRKRSTREGGAS